ncbi:HNH endonuclease [Halorientalis persicus]|uniref:HNH endonuclease n=1 Tax=Halorientalis persicus TaxID=1367881 RepID=A0A1H8U6R8_9EURY|nr:HNH endonuclease signature motif containing protein [Halorientalis persicus]SEO98970.1 HNH endonuclease [Halorientalis persicus]
MDTLFPQDHNSQCRVCGEPTVDGRWNYCSKRCREIAEAVQKMFVWDVVREQVLERDDHTCQKCGLSYDMAQRAYWQIEERIDELKEPLHPEKSDHPAASYDRWRRAGKELHRRYGWINFSNGAFHVDHITPISEGGHPFDEQNLQTLCRRCHREKTAEENSEPNRPAQAVTLDDYLETGESESAAPGSTNTEKGDQQ